MWPSLKWYWSRDQFYECVWLWFVFCSSFNFDIISSDAHPYNSALWIVISLSVSELFGSIFLNTAVMGIADFVANLTLLLVMPYFRRQVLTSLNFTLLGVCLITSSILRGFFYDTTRLADVVMMILAKFFASSIFNPTVSSSKFVFSWFCPVISDHVRTVSNGVSPHRMRLLIPSRSHLSRLL